MKRAFLSVYLCFFVLSAILFIEHNRWRNKLNDTGIPVPPLIKSELRSDWQRRLSQLADDSQVHEILQLSLEGSGRFTRVHLRWRVAPGEFMTFLNKLEAASIIGPLVKLSASPTAQNEVLMDALFEDKPGVLLPLTTPSLKNKKTPPLFWVAAPSQQILPAISSLKKNHQKENQKKEEERLAQLVLTQRENTRRKIESSWTLTGLVTKGSEPMALIDIKGSSPQLGLFKKGDEVDHVHIDSIDATRGEVFLNFEGTPLVSLRLGVKAL